MTYVPTKEDILELKLNPTTALYVNTNDLEGDLWISPDFWPYNIIWQDDRWYFLDDDYHYTIEIFPTSLEHLQQLISIFKPK